MPKQCYNFEMKSAGENAKLFLYDEIGFWGDDAQSFVGALQEVGDRDLDVHINSPGGSVFDGVAIYAALTQHKGAVNIYVDGLAASIASVIAMAGDRVVMAKPAMIFVHDPLTFTRGNADDHRQTADDLDAIKGGVINAYTQKTGLSTEQISAMMSADTWLNVDEAIEQGFADEAFEPSTPANFKNFLNKFENLPEHLQNESTEKRNIFADVFAKIFGKRDEAAPAEARETVTSTTESNEMTKKVENETEVETEVVDTVVDTEVETDSEQDAGASMQARIKQIMQSEAAQGREEMASHLAFDTDMSADAAIALLEKAPAAVENSDAGQTFVDQMNAEGGAGVETETETAQDAELKGASRLRAVHQKAGGNL